MTDPKPDKLADALRVLRARVAAEAAARTTGSVAVTVHLRDGVPTTVEVVVREANAK